MECPRRKMYVQIELGKTQEEFLPCQKEECAWWDRTSEKCAILSVVPEIVVIAKYLEKEELCLKQRQTRSIHVK